MGLPRKEFNCKSKEHQHQTFLTCRFCLSHFGPHDVTLVSHCFQTVDYLHFLERLEKEKCFSGNIELIVRDNDTNFTLQLFRTSVCKSCQNLRIFRQSIFNMSRSQKSSTFHKDVQKTTLEQVCLLHILEEVLPLVFFQYGAVSFKSTKLEDYESLILRFLILFIIWNLYHYDRCTLSMLNDLCHQIKKLLP